MASDEITGLVASGDVEIFYRKVGSPGRTPVLIAHGLSFFSYDWMPVASLIGQDREVVAMDMRGFGESTCSPERNYKLDTISGDVVAVLDALGWEKAVLMGHSFGGRVMLATAGWHADRAAALVSIDFAPDLNPAGRRRVAGRIGGQPDVFASVDEAMTHHHEAPGNTVRRRRWEAFLWKTDGGYALKRDLHFRDNFKRALESGKSAPVPEFLWPMLTDIEIPMMIIRASGSDMFVTETLDKVRSVNPRIHAIELEGSHDLAADNPNGLAQAVRNFLTEAKL
jgi:pimeloyl-ACP methyl ester carboxylesterase